MTRDGTPPPVALRGWGIVGTGAIAARFAVACREAGTPAVAVASRSAGTGGDFARRFALAGGAVDSVAALAAVPGVDAIYVATPNAAHRDGVLAALAARKPVLCEKPLATSHAEGAEIVDAARRAGVFCMEGLWSLCLPVYRDAFAAVARGEIGTLREIHGNFAVPNSPDTMPRLFAGPGAGALLDRGVYLLALSQALLGPLRLCAVRGDVDADGTDLAATLVLEGADGARAVLGCAIDRLGGNGLTLVGTTGRIVFDEPLSCPGGYVLRRADPATPFSGPGGLPGPAARIKARLAGRPRLRHLARALRSDIRGRPGGLADQIAHVRACLARGATESDLVPLDGSLAVLHLIDAARAALRNAAP
ncbi:Gfo/Idh/MocA family protein [Meridianimarinicoccus sp. RP-17]